VVLSGAHGVTKRPSCGPKMNGVLRSDAEEKAGLPACNAPREQDWPKSIDSIIKYAARCTGSVD